MEAGAHGCVYPEKSPCELSAAISVEGRAHACGYPEKKGGEDSLILMIWSMIELSGLKSTLELILNLLSPFQG